MNQKDYLNSSGKRKPQTASGAKNNNSGQKRNIMVTSNAQNQFVHQEIQGIPQQNKMMTINKPKSATGHRINYSKINPQINDYLDRFKSLHNSGRFVNTPA